MPFDFQPTLKGRLLELRPLRSDDWPGLFAAASDPLIWEQHPERDRYQERVFRRFFNAALECRGALLVRKMVKARIAENAGRSRKSK